MPLAGTPPRYYFNDRERDDLEIGDHTALGDVLQVTLYHAVKVGVVAVSHLPPARNSGLDCQALQVVFGVLRHLVGQRRAGADDGHLAQEHVYELRELVDGMLSDELSDLGDAGVFLHLEHGAGDFVVLPELGEALVGVPVHGAELPHAEGGQAAVGAGLAHADLAVEGAAFALQADGSGENQTGDGNDRQRATAKHDVERALDGPVGQARAVPIHDGLHGLVAAGALAPVHGLSNERRPRGRIRCILSFIRHVLFQHFVPGSGILPGLHDNRQQLGNRLFKVSHHTLLVRKHRKANAGGYASATQIELQISRALASINGFDKTFVA